MASNKTYSYLEAFEKMEMGVCLICDKLITEENHYRSAHKNVLFFWFVKEESEKEELENEDEALPLSLLSTTSTTFTSDSTSDMSDTENAPVEGNPTADLVSEMIANSEHLDRAFTPFGVLDNTLAHKTLSSKLDSDDLVVDSIPEAVEEQMEKVPKIIQLQVCSEFFLHCPEILLPQWNAFIIPCSQLCCNFVSLESNVVRPSRYEIGPIELITMMPSLSPWFEPPPKPPDTITAPTPPLNLSLSHSLINFLKCSYSIYAHQVFDKGATLKLSITPPQYLLDVIEEFHKEASLLFQGFCAKEFAGFEGWFLPDSIAYTKAKSLSLLDCCHMFVEMPLNICLCKVNNTWKPNVLEQLICVANISGDLEVVVNGMHLLVTFVEAIHTIIKNLSMTGLGKFNPTYLEQVGWLTIWNPSFMKDAQVSLLLGRCDEFMVLETIEVWDTCTFSGTSDENGAFGLFCNMFESEIKFAEFTLPSVLKGCANTGDLGNGQLVYYVAIKSGCELDKFLGSNLVDMYSKCHLVGDVLKLFSVILDHDVVLWSAMIACLGRQGHSKETSRIFYLMRNTCVEPCQFTFASVVSATAELDDFDYEKSIHAYIFKYGFKYDISASNALVKMHMKHGCVHDGAEFLCSNWWVQGGLPRQADIDKMNHGFDSYNGFKHVPDLTLKLLHAHIGSYLNEFDPKYSAIDWRLKLEIQRGAFNVYDLEEVEAILVDAGMVFIYWFVVMPDFVFQFQQASKGGFSGTSTLTNFVHHACWLFLILALVDEINLDVGPKLQVLLTKVALEITERCVVVQGMPLVQALDRYFWLGQPQLMLPLTHIALFQNAFQITYILWTWYCFGQEICFCVDYKLAIIKVVFGDDIASLVMASSASIQRQQELLKWLLELWCQRWTRLEMAFKVVFLNDEHGSLFVITFECQNCYAVTVYHRKMIDRGRVHIPLVSFRMGLATIKGLEQPNEIIRPVMVAFLVDVVAHYEEIGSTSHLGDLLKFCVALILF